MKLMFFSMMFPFVGQFFTTPRRFGFANPEAIRSGQTGTACRGEEHDVTLVWSLTSGKRIVLADGQEVHFSNSRSNVFEYTWTMKGNQVLKIIAHAAPPLSPTPGFRQYDFFVNGQTFFSFPKVFRIGLAPNDPRGQLSPVSPTGMAESTRNHRNPGGAGGMGGPRRPSNIANLEAPGNPDEVRDCNVCCRDCSRSCHRRFLHH
jgi:hypothetical protein